MSIWIKHWIHAFLHPVDWELERHLAGAADRADLEHRLREWERRERLR